jgi:hypothetical protein
MAAANRGNPLEHIEDLRLARAGAGFLTESSGDAAAIRKPTCDHPNFALGDPDPVSGTSVMKVARLPLRRR